VVRYGDVPHGWVRSGKACYESGERKHMARLGDVWRDEARRGAASRGEAR